MRVNLNPSINQSRPNFKASFSNDAETRKVINDVRITREGFANILTTHYALKDMDSNDIIGLARGEDGDYYAKNLTNGKEIKLSLGLTEYTSSKLTRAIDNRELIDEEPKLKWKEYYNRACDLIRTTTKKEYDTAEKLRSRIEMLNARGEIKKADDLRYKLSKVNGNKNKKILDAIERELFSVS